MDKIKVATVALNQTPLDWEGNERRLIEALGKAVEQEIGIVCFPEMAVSGYGCEDVFLSDYLYDESLLVLKSIIPYTKDITAVIGIPLKVEGRRYSALALVVDAKLVGFYCKKHLANDGLHYEHRWFTPWQDGAVSEVDFYGGSVPAGDLVFEFSNQQRLGFEICEDAWVDSRLTGNQHVFKPTVICNPSASHFAFQKHHTRQKLVTDGASMVGGTYLYSNMSSNEAGRIIYDGSCIIADDGKIVSENKRFSFVEVQIDEAVVSVRKDESNKVGSGLIELVWHPKNTNELLSEESTQLERYSVEQEFLLAETLALFDYLRKSYSKGFILSLSGGVDSATCAALIYFMVQRAVNELGLEKFKERLSYFTQIQDAKSVEDVMPYMLSCVYQATANSGSVTENAAKSLAEEISSTYSFFDVESLVQGYKSIVSKAINREFTWEQDDLALQNIQARVRAPGVWFMTNLRGGLLVTTSNRSEAAVGYATMDGDTCGSICPLGGVDKTFLRNWLVKVEKEGLCGCTPIPSLKFVNEQEPTAELRPPGSEQKDEEDLMPYEVLDFIEKASIRDKKSPADIFSGLMDTFSPSKEKAYFWLEKFYALWSRNQWKRERYAPSFHMDDENLDPKTWCRFPIISGGYKREMNRLKSEVFK